MARKKRELKKGDLVTFTSRAMKMTNLYRWGPMKDRPPLVGMIVKIKESYKWKYTWTGPNGLVVKVPQVESIGTDTLSEKILNSSRN